MNDYERVAEVIRYLDAHQLEQPGLETLASQAGLSTAHFHRLFSRWAGVTPKDFLQCLTLENARERLQRGQSVFDAALDAGLSSAGRLHDLCVTLEAATPGEMKTGGAGWTIDAGFAETPFGLCCIGNGPRGLCFLEFVENRDRRALMAAWPKAEIRWSDKAAEEIAVQVFQNGQKADLKAFVRGTPFQLRVWRALVRVPAGALVSYGQLAEAVEHPGAARAVGTAVGSNPLAYLIPCHRVIRETGVIGQYRWGRERKRVLLGWEALRSRADS
jgi:AraC family transcriptional regulator of adaptative response/methylated-DNA-[protein]-cysteine methyltransferase